MAERDATSDPAALREELDRLRSALRQAEARAEHAERLAAVGRLVAGVIHELNNPLTAVTMYAEALADAASGGAEREKAAAMLEASTRIQRLARELIGYVRPAGPPAVQDLGELVDEAVRLCRPELKACGAALHREPGTAAVPGSRQSLVQAVVALVSNAALATGPGRHIRVAVAPAPGQASVIVADDGAGMPEPVRARAFEAFFTTRPERGLGLGLSTARAIVERHGGSIALESAPGTGTTATLVLPAR